MPARRVDISATVPKQWHTHILYFTGSDHFNRSMRSFAGQMGFALNEKSLTRAVRADACLLLETACLLLETTCLLLKDCLLAHRRRFPL